MLLLAAAAVFLCGCTLFLQPREGDPPDGETPWWWQEPSSPQILSDNLQNCWVYGSSSLYADLLDEANFSFTPDPLDGDWLIELLEGWDYDREIAFADQILLTQDITLTLEMPDDPGLADEPGPVGETDLYRDYVLVIPGNDWAPDSTNAAKGLAAFHLVEDGLGLWSIAAWRDERTEATGTGDWGLIRGSY